MQPTITYAQLLAELIGQLTPTVAEPRYDALLLLCHALHISRAQALAYGERDVLPDQAQQARDWAKRAAAGEPIPYILGEWGFYDRDFIVTPDVLIPRPETELLLEEALRWGQGRAGRWIGRSAADIGTGSGALAVTLAAHWPDASVWGIDISPAALEIARRNAHRHQVRNIQWRQGDLAVPLVQEGVLVSVVLANLPYIPRELAQSLPVARYEPLLALDGGADGLDLVRRLLADVPTICEDLALFEIMSGQGAAALRAVAAVPALADWQAEILRDYAGHERILRLERRTT